mgnify:CR=1 FL=1
MLKVLHTADWHIGNFPAPASKSRTNLRYLDICAYIEFLIAKAEEMKPDIIIIAGDIFNQAKTWSDRGLQETNTIVEYISKLSDIAPVYALRGTANHDGKMHYDLLTTALKDNQNVFIIDEPCIKNANNRAAIAFVPIFDKNQHRIESDIPMDKEAENNYFCDKVRDAILDLKLEADKYCPNLPTILVTHYTVLGSIMPNGQTSIFATNEVVIDPITLIQSDYTLTCLGHVHKPQQLETCPNTFYAGSLCALNFNDENDPHGFYMHYVDTNGDVASEFIETPSRQFHTIWFNDAQLTDIIAKDYDLANYVDTSFAGSIIRVIYNCTDVTDKSLNKALLEKALYKHTEAFYVQEIIPSEINITVDRTTMRNTSSIGDNLLQFLRNEQTEHGSITDKQIEDCLDIAQPIIDDLLANTSSNHNVGIFTPIEIEVKNYRNYKSAIFNYDDVKFCVINGDNGAGKSSLFMDAMLDALFEETREGDITGWINNDINARSGSIKFTFSIGDNIYKITRTRQKSGKATLNLAQFVTDSENNQTWVDMSEEKLKDTQTVINNLIGMNAVTLKSCGLIMQDAYGLFLQADKNTRMDILGDILNLSIYDDLHEAAAEFNRMCQSELVRINDEETNILSNIKNGDEIQTNLNAAYADNSEYERELKDCNNNLVTLTLKREALVKDVDTFKRLDADITTLNNKAQTLHVTLESQNTIFLNAYNIVSGENAYIEKTKRHADLVLQEKEMSEKISRIQTLMAEKNRIENEIASLNTVNNDADSKITVIEKKMRDIEFELAASEDTESKAKLYEQTKLEIADIERCLDEIRALESAYTEKDVLVSEINHDMASLRVEFDLKFDEIDKKARILAESNCPIAEKATCRFLADAQQALASKPALTDEYNRKFCSYVQRLDVLKKDMDEISNKIASLRENLPDINVKKQELAVYEACAFKMASIPELKNTYNVYNQQLVEFGQIKIDNIAKIGNFTKQINDIAQQISMLTAETINYDSIKAEIAAIGDIVAQGNDIAANKAIMATADSRIKEITAELAALNNEIAAKTTQRDATNIDNLAINRVDADILACHTRTDLLNKNLADNSKIIGKLELEMKQYQNDIRQLDKLKQLKDKMSYSASNAGWLKKAFNRNGIPHNIIRSVIPILENTASNILNQMSGNTMSIELRTEKMLTTKKEIATLDIIVCDTITGNLPYLSRSGGERVKAALSIVLALAEIKSSESGTQLGFLFIDEPPFLDSNGIEAYCDALEAIQRRYSNLKIIAITHDPEMKSRFAQSIDVIKTPDGSEIYANL